MGFGNGLWDAKMGFGMLVWDLGMGFGSWEWALGVPIFSILPGHREELIPDFQPLIPNFQPLIPDFPASGALRAPQELSLPVGLDPSAPP